MRRLLAVLPLLALAACTGSGGTFADIGSQGDILAVAKRHAAPSLSGRLLDGGHGSLASYKGKVVVVNLWGSWCGPCKGEADALTQVSSDAAPAGGVVLGVDTRDTDNQAKAFREKRGQTYPTLVDTDGSLTAHWTPFPATGTPITVLVDRRGRVAGRFIGAVSYTELSKAVSTLAAEPA